MEKNREIIQQWQYLGKLRPELLKNEVLENCRKIGITSLQSYLYWSEIEKEPGKIDFSSYDALLRKLKEHNLKWVPFLILGPNYATPDWFKESKESVFAKCLEHQKESKIQSIWNPYLPKYIDRFLKLVSEHYKNDKDALESVLLGISGNWGETLYPANGGFQRNFHTHSGWWSGDKYARQSFVDFAVRKYNSLKEINSAWRTDFSSVEKITFPAVKKIKSEFINFLFPLLKISPKFIKNSLKFFLKIGNKNSFIFQEKTAQPLKIQTPEEKRYWLDFVDWYLGSMTNWAELWLKTARKYFPNNEIYLVAGGTGNPASGADFSRQAKVVAKYGAGVRITNQTNDYCQSFILTRLVASAAKFYKGCFITEEAAVLQNFKGTVMRIFDALSSGAKGIYCKNFISTGGDPCLKEKLPVGELTGAGKALVKNLRYFVSVGRPIIKAAVLFPNTSIAFNSSIIINLYNKCALLRDIFDFDLIDEKMIIDGALNKYQFFIILEGDTSPREISVKIKEWENRGGILIQSQGKINYLEFIKDVLSKHQEICPWLLKIDGLADGIYASMFPSKIVYYNSNNFKKVKKADFLKKKIEIEPNSIKILSF